MGLDAFLRHQADLLLARRLLRFLLLAPLATLPLTVAIDATLLGPAEMIEQRSPADVVLLHLPGLIYLYPAYRLSRHGRLNRTLILPAALGLLSYVVPQALWLVTLHAAQRVPPLISPISIIGMSVESSLYGLVLWCLTLSVYDGYREA